jgi:(2Fe-2S) ferredoxin
VRRVLRTLDKVGLRQVELAGDGLHRGIAWTVRGKCLKRCVSDPALAVFRYGQAYRGIVLQGVRIVVVQPALGSQMHHGPKQGRQVVDDVGLTATALHPRRHPRNNPGGAEHFVQQHRTRIAGQPLRHLALRKDSPDPASMPERPKAVSAGQFSSSPKTAPHW